MSTKVSRYAEETCANVNIHTQVTRTHARTHTRTHAHTHAHTTLAHTDTHTDTLHTHTTHTLHTHYTHTTHTYTTKKAFGCCLVISELAMKYLCTT